MLHHGNECMEVLFEAHLPKGEKEWCFGLVNEGRFLLRQVIHVGDAVVNHCRCFLDSPYMTLYLLFYEMGDSADVMRVSDAKVSLHDVAQFVDAIFLIEIVQVVNGQQLQGFLGMVAISELLMGGVPQVDGLFVVVQVGP